MKLFKKLFGSRNARDLKKRQPTVDSVFALSETMEAKSDAELKAMTGVLRQKLDNGATLDDIMVEAFAVVREAAWRTLKMRHFPVQILGAMILHEGTIAEMRTGEGKTLTATGPVYLNALEQKGVHVVTVNDYLASRDAEWMGQIYRYLGLDVGVIVHGISDYNRKKAYQADITYGQNNEFGFDYLRDNMKMNPDRMVQRGLRYAVIDEVDSILIDEARTPLIISGRAAQEETYYETVDRIVPRLRRDIDYVVDEKAHSVMLTDSGVERVQKLLGIDNLYDPVNIRHNHHVRQALKAHTLYKRDDRYLVEDGQVVIVDEHTGRKMPGRRWSDGLHQAIEAKENVKIKEEDQTLATVTFQNFFRMYDKLSGMTGTADTEAGEFHHIYKLNVLVIPTNKPLIRKDQPDLIYKNEQGKFHAVFEEILDAHKRGQPVLVGTTSVEKSEILAKLLRKKTVPFEVLNAKQHEREANVVAQAGRKGAITISTNMAGRGTDIHLGGNAEHMAEQMAAAEGRASEPEHLEEVQAKFREQCSAERDEVLAAGGLKIIGTERHESRRIDNQLRGRAGRQGDPGESRFYLSLDDDLMRIFGGDRVGGLMEKLGMEEDVPLEHSWVTKSIENAQKRVEGQNFDSRKSVLEYDDVMNDQRKAIYGLRKQILLGQYSPTLSEDELNAGKVAKPPTESGDWTKDSLSGDVSETIEVLVKAAYNLEAEMAGGEIHFDPETPKAWRQLRTEVWRKTGCFCSNVEKMFAAGEKEITDYLVDETTGSMIQQRERLYDLCDELIAELIETHCPAGQVDSWDIPGLMDSVADQFNVEVKIKKKASNQEKIANGIWKKVEAKITEREEELKRPWLLYFARHFNLEEIDQQWLEHLKIMAHLREGIGLRGYGQKDPKKEYKKEGFDLFAAMMERIRTNAAKKIFRVQLARQEEEVPQMASKQRNTTASHDDGNSVYGDAADGGKKADEKPKTVRRTQPKVGRNDPCPCGSGKKYKKCHGREGAQPSA